MSETSTQCHFLITKSHWRNANAGHAKLGAKMPVTSSTNSMSTSGDQTVKQDHNMSQTQTPRFLVKVHRHCDLRSSRRRSSFKNDSMGVGALARSHCQTPFPNRSTGKCRSHPLSLVILPSKMDLSRNWLIGVCRAMCSFSVEASWKKKTMQTETLLCLVDRVLDLMKESSSPWTKLRAK